MGADDDGPWADDADDRACDHDDYDLDILTGRATCNMCGERWWASDIEQMNYFLKAYREPQP